ncbi:MAG: hypothetical protein ACRDQ5_16565 [Sciscionella sp.]
MNRPADRPELTSYERVLIDSDPDFRGYTPDDKVPEPTVGPSEPAGPAKADRDSKSK